MMWHCLKAVDNISECFIEKQDVDRKSEHNYAFGVLFCPSI
jgi:hypothetical protein